MAQISGLWTVVDLFDFVMHATIATYLTGSPS